MAEIVNRNNEESLPQFEEIIKLELFSPAELKEIIRRHVQYEYKIVRREKHVKDFQEYVNYKINFLKLVKIRMKLKKVNKKERRKVEKMLVKHVSKLYNLMMKYFSTDVSLWLDFIDFTIKERDFPRTVILYDSLLSFHMGDALLFVKAAKFLIKHVKDIDIARKTLFKGIRLHKGEPQLYLEFFRIELDFVAKKRRELKEDPVKLDKDAVLEGKTAEVVCFSALKAIKNMDFKFDLLRICAKYNFAVDLKFKIYEILKNDHGFEAEMWKRVALLEMDGISLEEIDMTGLKSKDLFKQRVWKCFQVFLIAVKTVPTEAMWYHFIDSFFEIFKSHPEEHEFMNRLLLKLMSREDVQDVLKEDHCVSWIENLEKYHLPENSIDFINASIELYPKSIKLWLKKLQYHLNQRNLDKIKEVFSEAHLNLKDETAQYSLWQFLLQSSVNFPADEVSSFFDTLMKESLIAYSTLRPLYLNWIISKKDLTKTREIFANLCQLPPYNIDFYKKMIDIELSQQKVDVNRIRYLFTAACIYFGSTNSNLWADYLRFEKVYGDPLLVNDVYWKAVKQLNPAASDQFIAEYSLSKIE